MAIDIYAIVARAKAKALAEMAATTTPKEARDVHAETDRLITRLDQLTADLALLAVRVRRTKTLSTAALLDLADEGALTARDSADHLRSIGNV